MTPTPRPDVEGMKKRAESARECLFGWERKEGKAEAINELRRTCSDALFLIAHIKALEARQVKLEAVVEVARHLEAECHDKVGRFRQARYPSPEDLIGLDRSLAALGDGDV